jgi:NMD protein affecting ribosome stability and mRNA decay
MITQKEEKLNVNKKMIGQTVYVQEKASNNWYGEVIDAEDYETFLVKNPKTQEQKTVSIFDIRGCRS